MIDSSSATSIHAQPAPTGLYAATVLYFAAFLAYAETKAFCFDEAYHLLTAQLILAGKKPYIDFCFPQAPLNAYWNALWMALFGQTWRVAHAAAALATVGAVLLIADYVARRFLHVEWRIMAVATAGLAFGLNPVVFTYGSVAQPYGLCLLALVVAFRFAVRAVESEAVGYNAAAGLFAGIAAASSLLTAAAVPVLLAWTFVHNRSGRRFTKSLAFLVALVLPFAPAVWLFMLSPRVTWFNLVQYHATYRRLYWADVNGHDFEVLTSWLRSGPAFALGMLAVCGWLYITRHRDWPRPIEAEFRLCGWLALGLGAEVGIAHPTFEQYFLLIVPFLAVLAAAGMYAIAVRLFKLRGSVAALLVVALFSLGLVRVLYDERDDDDWSVYERLAHQIDSVTPLNATILATEPVYFLTRRVPPPGLEFYYTHLLKLPSSERALLHVITNDELRQQLRAGRFATAYECEDDNVKFGLDYLYHHNRKISDCSVYWDF